MSQELTSHILFNYAFEEENKILQKTKSSFDILKIFMDDPKVINLSDSIDKTIEGVNKFYALIDIARVNEEKLNNKFYRNFLGFSLCCLKK